METETEGAAPEGDLQEEVPEEVRAGLRLGPDEEVRLSLSTDIKLDGRYGSAWVLATDRRLLAFSPDGEGPPDIVQVPLADITEVEIRNLLASGALKVRTAREGATVALFSKSLLPKFSDMPDRIETLVKQARPAGDREEVVKRTVGGGKAHHKRCQQCGRPIREWMGVCQACLDTRKLFARLMSYALPYWGLATISLILLLTATFIGLTPPLLMRSLIDDVLAPAGSRVQAVPSAPGPRAEAPPVRDGGERSQVSRAKGGANKLAVLVALLLLVNVSRNALGAFRSFIMARVGQRVTFDLRRQVYQHLHCLSLSFYNERETGRIMASITQDVSRLQDFISDGLQEVIRNVLTILIICVILFSINPGLAALVLLPTPFLVWTTRHFGRRLHDIYHGLWRRMAGLSALLADVIPGVRVVKAFAQEKREVDRFEGTSQALLAGELRVARIRSVFSPLMTFLTSIGGLLIWWVGGLKVIGGTLTLGDFVAFTGYMWQFYPLPAQQPLPARGHLRRARLRGPGHPARRGRQARRRPPAPDPGAGGVPGCDLRL